MHMRWETVYEKTKSQGNELILYIYIDTDRDLYYNTYHNSYNYNYAFVCILHKGKIHVYSCVLLLSLFFECLVTVEFVLLVFPTISLEA